MKKKVLCLMLALALCAGLAAPALAADEWQPTGRAYYSDTEDYYVLTEDAQQVFGGIWLDDFFYKDFTLEFDYYTGINPTHGTVGFDPTGADGIRISFFLPSGYTIADTEKNMGEGGSMGYYGLGFGIELDTFYNPEKKDPMAANHIALMKDGADNHLAVKALPESEDAQWHHLKIVVEENTCSVFVDEIEKFTYNGLESTACGLLGITAATGDDTNEHMVKNITYEGSGEPETKPEPPAPAPAPTSPLSAVATASTVLVNGENVAFDAYNINGNNYFKLRDLAYALNSSEKQFEVAWDGANNAISLRSGQPYTEVGGEMGGKSAGNKTPTPTSAKTLLDGKEVEFTAYNIDGNNYFRLRDIGLAFDFSVEWDGAKNTIVIDTSKGYTTE